MVCSQSNDRCGGTSCVQHRSIAGMKFYRASATPLYLALSAGLLSACVSPSQKTSSGRTPLVGTATKLEAGPFSVKVSDLAVRSNPKLWSASLDSSEVLGLFRVGSRYDLVRGTWQDAAPELAGQRISQQLSAALPVPLTSSNLQLDWSGGQEHFWSDTGLTSQRIATTRAHWAPGRYALDIRTTETPTNNGGQHCDVDARLSDQQPLATLGGSLLSVGSRRCERQETYGNQSAQLWDVQASWAQGDGLGLPGLTALRIAGVHPAESNVTASSPVTPSLELSARSSLQLGGWALSSEVAASPTGTAAWGSRARLTRSIAGTPVTAAWARNQPRLWALAPTTVASQEASLGLDLSPQLRPLLGGILAANLSYKRVDYDSGVLPSDDQLHLGVSANW